MCLVLLVAVSALVREDRVSVAVAHGGETAAAVQAEAGVDAAAGTGAQPGWGPMTQYLVLGIQGNPEPRWLKWQISETVKAVFTPGMVACGDSRYWELYDSAWHEHNPITRTKEACPCGAAPLEAREVEACIQSGKQQAGYIASGESRLIVLSPQTELPMPDWHVVARMPVSTMLTGVRYMSHSGLTSGAGDHELSEDTWEILSKVGSMLPASYKGLGTARRETPGKTLEQMEDERQRRIRKFQLEARAAFSPTWIKENVDCPVGSRMTASHVRQSLGDLVTLHKPRDPPICGGSEHGSACLYYPGSGSGSSFCQCGPMDDYRQGKAEPCKQVLNDAWLQLNEQPARPGVPKVITPVANPEYFTNPAGEIALAGKRADLKTMSPFEQDFRKAR